MPFYTRKFRYLYFIKISCNSLGLKNGTGLPAGRQAIYGTVVPHITEETYEKNNFNYRSDSFIVFM